MRRAVLLAAACAALCGCKREDMVAQRKARSWRPSTVFADGTVMRTPPAATVRTDAAPPPAMPARMDAALLARGQLHYGIYCVACHGAAGTGDGMVTRRGFPAPPDLTARPVDVVAAFGAISHGQGAMYGFADRLSVPDRWAVVAYLRALRLAAHVDTAQLGDADRARLAAMP